MAIGSLAEAANQKGDFAQNAAKMPELTLPLRVLSTAAKVGRGITAVRGENITSRSAIAPSVPRCGDVPIMTSDVVPPKQNLAINCRGYSEES